MEKRTKALESAARRVGENVRRLRTERCWTLADLADRVTDSGYPMTFGTVSKIERQVRSVDPDELEALAWAFDLESVDGLFVSPTEVATEVRRALSRYLEALSRRQRAATELEVADAALDRARAGLVSATAEDEHLSALATVLMDGEIRATAAGHVGQDPGTVYYFDADDGSVWRDEELARALKELRDL